MKIGYACSRVLQTARRHPDPTRTNTWSCPQLVDKLYIDVIVQCLNQEVSWYHRYGDKLL
jgi:hypothetical protein